MPNSTPLRAMTVTRLLPATPCAASSIALQAAIEMLRKKWSLPAMNSIRSDADFHPVARHGRPQAAAGDAVRGVEHRLAGRHRDVEEEVVVAGDEFDHRRHVARGRAGLEQRGHQLLDEKRRGGGVAVVHLVA